MNRKKANSIVILFAITYMVSYITRINYGAVVSEMQSATGFSKELLSMSLTGISITYGIGQILSGILGDKISPKKIITMGLAVASGMNLLIPICKNPYQMLIVWCINGFAQSCMWPPMVKIMSAELSGEEYSNAVCKIAYGSSAGSIAVYLLSPFIISVSSWKMVFAAAAIIGFVMLFVWNKFAADVKVEPREILKSEKTENKKTKIFTPVLVGIMVGIILQGMLRDGVTTWMPSYIAETYNLSNVISILTGVVLPIFSIVCFKLATAIYVEKIKNPLYCGALFFGIGTLSALGISIFTGKNAALSVIMSALLTGCMHGVNLMLISIVPSFFKNTGRVGTISGILNSCTYVGSAISTYGIAVLSESFGWSTAVLCWLAVAFFGTVVCAVCGKNWKKYRALL